MVKRSLVHEKLHDFDPNLTKSDQFLISLDAKIENDRLKKKNLLRLKK